MYDDIIICERDQEINKLITMITELAEVFKSLNQLVIDEGTTLDRIDLQYLQSQLQCQESQLRIEKS